MYESKILVIEEIIKWYRVGNKDWAMLKIDAHSCFGQLGGGRQRENLCVKTRLMSLNSSSLRGHFRAAGFIHSKTQNCSQELSSCRRIAWYGIG